MEIPFDEVTPDECECTKTIMLEECINNQDRYIKELQEIIKNKDKRIYELEKLVDELLKENIAFKKVIEKWKGE